MPDAAEFWADFKARARYVPQDQFAQAAHAPYNILRWTVATACGLLLVVLGMNFWPRSGSPQQDFSQVRSLHVDTPYKGVMIMNDEASKATVVWIVGMELPSDED